MNTPLYCAVPEYILDEKHLTKQSIAHIKQFHALPTILNPSVTPITKDKQAKLLGLTSFDTALPQDWVDDVRARTSLNPAPHFVWDYSMSIGGEPFPITVQGEIILKINRHVKYLYK